MTVWLGKYLYAMGRWPPAVILVVFCCITVNVTATFLTRSKAGQWKVGRTTLRWPLRAVLKPVCWPLWHYFAAKTPKLFCRRKTSVIGVSGISHIRRGACYEE